MKQVDIRVGGRYLARVSGRVITVRVDSIREGAEFRGRKQTRYGVTNLSTGRTTVFQSAGRFRGPAPEEGENRPDPTPRARTASATDSSAAVPISVYLTSGNAAGPDHLNMAAAYMRDNPPPVPSACLGPSFVPAEEGGAGPAGGLAYRGPDENSENSAGE